MWSTATTIAGFTGDEFENNATPETLERARNLFSNIFFRTQDTRMLDIQQCRIDIEKLVFVTEIDACNKDYSKRSIESCIASGAKPLAILNLLVSLKVANQGLSYRKAGLDGAIRTVANTLKHENVTRKVQF